ncbi:MAG: adenylate kinase [bacterium]|nr:adenylate kinase [bacterium]
MRLVFFGAPGSGKGTQSKRICQELSIPQLSTGDMLRQAIKDGSALGKEAKGYMDGGNLVPDQLILGLIAERIDQPDCKQGYILDGFPRTLPQAEALDGMLSEKGQAIDKVVYLEIDPELVVARLVGRRVCSACGEEFHVTNRKPKADGICDLCGAPLIQRPDDQEEQIRVRLNSYKQQTAPVADHYQAQGVLAQVAAEGEIGEITHSILKKLQ